MSCKGLAESPDAHTACVGAGKLLPDCVFASVGTMEWAADARTQRLMTSGALTRQAQGSFIAVIQAQDHVPHCAAPYQCIGS